MLLDPKICVSYICTTGVSISCVKRVNILVDIEYKNIHTMRQKNVKKTIVKCMNIQAGINIQMNFFSFFV